MFMCQQVQELPSATTFTLQQRPPGLSHFTIDMYIGTKGFSLEKQHEKMEEF